MFKDLALHQKFSWLPKKCRANFCCVTTKILFLLGSKSNLFNTSVALNVKVLIPNIKQRTFRRETVQQMMEYYWPGNIRELKNVVERVYLFGEDEVIFPDALPKSIGGVSFSTVGDSFDEKIDAYKKSLILEAYERNGKNQREAAAKLKMTYDQIRHFYRKLK